MPVGIKLTVVLIPTSKALWEKLEIDAIDELKTKALRLNVIETGDHVAVRRTGTSGDVSVVCVHAVIGGEVNRRSRGEGLQIIFDLQGSSASEGSRGSDGGRI